MKITGHIKLTQHPPTATWRGGRFAVINGGVLDNFSEVGGYARSHAAPFPLLGLKLRLIQMMPARSGQGYRDEYVVMQECRLARLVAWYQRTVSRYISWWITRQLDKHPERQNYDIPKWTLAWLLYRPLLTSSPEPPV